MFTSLKTTPLRASKALLFALAIYPFIAVLHGCGPSALHILNQTVPSDTYLKTSDIYFDQQHNIALDIYQPKNIAQGNNAPVLVFFYGGSWQKGEKNQYDFVGEAFASQGYVVVIPDYRKWPEVKSPAFTQDAARAVAWVHNNISGYGGNARNLFISGHSAGAHLGAMLASDERFLQAAGVDRQAIRGFIGLAGPYDFDPGYSPESQEFFGPPSNYANVIPVNFIDGNEPPMLLLQGGADETVQPTNAARMSNKISAKGGDVRVKIYPDIGHSKILIAMADSFNSSAPVVADMLAFMQAKKLQ